MYQSRGTRVGVGPDCNYSGPCLPAAERDGVWILWGKGTICPTTFSSMGLKILVISWFCHYFFSFLSRQHLLFLPCLFGMYSKEQCFPGETLSSIPHEAPLTVELQTGRIKSFTCNKIYFNIWNQIRLLWMSHFGFQNFSSIYVWSPMSQRKSISNWHQISC